MMRTRRRPAGPHSSPDQSGLAERLRSADALELCDFGIARERLLEDDPDPGPVDLLIVGTRLEPCRLERRQHVPDLSVRDADGSAAIHDPGRVLGLACEELLA